MQIYIYMFDILLDEHVERIQSGKTGKIAVFVGLVHVCFQQLRWSSFQGGGGSLGRWMEQSMWVAWMKSAFFIDK